MRVIFPAGFVILLIVLAFRFPGNFIVQGHVADDAGKSLNGVQVTEKGTTNTTLTDVKGRFSISAGSQQSVLVFSRKGFSSQEVNIQGKKTLQVVLVRKAANNQDAILKEEEKLMIHPRPEANSEYLKKGKQASELHRKQVAANNQVNSIAMMPVEQRPGMQNPQGSVQRPEPWRKDHFNTEDYDGIVENRFLDVMENPLSTFSIDVDAASYSNIRRFVQMGQLPPAGSVRIEEMINYFHYDYPQPGQEHPFSIQTEMAECPWNTQHRLVLIGLQGKKISAGNLPASNIVFLIDVSGSMMPYNKLPLVKSSMKLLADQLREQDKVSIVVYAGNAGLVLPATSGAEKMKIRNAIDQLEAGGSTAGGEGIKLAYSTAVKNYIRNGNNRVILCTDGDFNVGVSSDAALERLIEEKRQSGVFLTVLGYGMGNYKDNKMQKLADKGNGNHAYIDGIGEAKKVLVSEFGGTLFTIAKDVKLQIEFNPAKVQSYRLIGYENRMLNKEDFSNDKKDAGELGSGHTVTALYEVIPVGAKNDFLEKVDPLKYQPEKRPAVYAPKQTNEIMTIKFRYKKPDEDNSRLIVHPVTDRDMPLAKTSSNFRFAAAVAEFGMLLRNSEFKQSASFRHAWQMAGGALDNDTEGYRSEFLQLVKNAELLAGQPGNEPVTIKE
jgi:Ca-activated chloride channel family protein